MASNNGKSRTVERINSQVYWYIRQGWADVRAGKPYHKDYDTWLGYQQVAYETGRLYATEAKPLGLLDEWVHRKDFSWHPPLVETAYRAKKSGFPAVPPAVILEAS